MSRNRLFTFVVVALSAALIAAAPAAFTRDTAAEGSFDRTLKVTGAVDLTVTTGSGSIDVRTGDASAVAIHARIRANDSWHISSQRAEEMIKRIEANPPIEQSGNTIRIGRMDDEDLRRNISISYELVVPQQTRLRSETGSGSQTVEGIRGPLEASTGSGHVRASRIGAETTVTTGSGGIELDDVDGSVRATAGSGHIHALRVAGGFSGRTGSGGVELELTKPGNVEVETGSGSVSVRGVNGSLRVRTGSGTIRADGAPAADWRLHTGSGSITLRLPSDAKFEVSAHTSSGSVRTAHPILVEGVLNHHELRGKVRGGGPLIEASTSSGSIEIE